MAISAALRKLIDGSILVLSVGIKLWPEEVMLEVVDGFVERRAEADIERTCFQKLPTIVCCSEAAGKYQRVVLERFCMHWLRKEASGRRSCSHKWEDLIAYKALFIVVIV